MIACLEKSRRNNQNIVRYCKIANMMGYKVSTQNLIISLHSKKIAMRIMEL